MKQIKYQLNSVYNLRVCGEAPSPHSSQNFQEDLSGAADVY